MAAAASCCSALHRLSSLRAALPSVARSAVAASTSASVPSSPVAAPCLAASTSSCVTARPFSSRPPRLQQQHCQRRTSNQRNDAANSAVDNFARNRRAKAAKGSSLRTHAVSIFDGDYTDPNDLDVDGEEQPFAEGPEYDDLDDDGWSGITPEENVSLYKKWEDSALEDMAKAREDDGEGGRPYNPDDYGLQMGSGTSEADQILQQEALRQQREDDAQRKRWAENARPKTRAREIDERGRAYGRGGRKTASARVWIYPGEGMISVNRRDFVDYFPRESHRESILGPFVATRTAGFFDVRVQVEGGGLSGKAGAVRHGLARALERYNPDYRPAMKRLGYLTRDSRMVERKKVGKKKARKSPQWVRR